MNSGNRHTKALSEIDWKVFSSNIWFVASQPLKEIYDGLRTKTMPLGQCLIASSFVCWTMVFHWDFLFLKMLKLNTFYPIRFHWLYAMFLISSPFWLWGLWKTGQRRSLITKLTEIFMATGLKNKLGHLPGFLFDAPLDQFSRKLRLSRAYLPMEDFHKAKSSLESALQIYIDEIRENREEGTVDITYAHTPMPSLVDLKDIATLKDCTFAVGNTRSTPMNVSLRDYPHILVAGHTQSGKSTFLRQMITTLYLNNTRAEFVLIDLKEGLEFQLFERLPRVNVLTTVGEAAREMDLIQETLNERMRFLKEHGLKDIDALELKIREKKDDKEVQSLARRMPRKIIVVDEAADMFISGGGGKADEIQTGRRVLTQVARKGRAVGLHLILATQRPDVQSLDSQVKANLPGILAFRMSNMHSSMTILDNGRAADLPLIKGRAIWKQGGELLEVQTPFLTTEKADELLSKFREPAESQTSKPSKQKGLPASPTQVTQFAQSTRDEDDKQ